MEDLAEFIALNHLGSFGKNLSSLKKKKKFIYRLRVGPYGEDLDHSFSPNGPPGRQITYISFFLEGTVKNPAN